MRSPVNLFAQDRVDTGSGRKGEKLDNPKRNQCHPHSCLPNKGLRYVETDRAICRYSSPLLLVG
jgi:hypothetical protein